MTSDRQDPRFCRLLTSWEPDYAEAIKKTLLELQRETLQQFAREMADKFRERGAFESSHAMAHGYEQSARLILDAAGIGGGDE